MHTMSVGSHVCVCGGWGGVEKVRGGDDKAQAYAGRHGAHGERSRAKADTNLLNRGSMMCFEALWT